MFSSGRPRVIKLVYLLLNISSWFRNFACSPPPSYQEVYAAERDQPPTYEDVVKLDADQNNVQTQDDGEEQIEPDELEAEIDHHDNQQQQMSDFLEHDNQDNLGISTNDEARENPVVERES